MTDISRRQFVALAAAGAALGPLAPAHATTSAITAQQIIDRIRTRMEAEWKVEWKTPTVDTVKAGDAAAAVTGIATTALPTVDVLRRAVKAGANMIITCEPTFYSRSDTSTPPARPGTAPSDPIFSAKDEFIRKNGLIVWRFSDHWRLRTPNPFARGLADALGWSKLPLTGDPATLAIPEISLDALAARVKQHLDARGGIRVVGDPALRVRKVGLLPGSTPLQASLSLLAGADVIVAGEVREWESVEYARDTVTAGGARGLLLVGRIVSEDPGMNVCAEWLGSVVPELKTTWLTAGDPYWRPR